MDFTAAVEHCKETGLYAGCAPDFTGAHIVRYVKPSMIQEDGAV